MTKAAKAGPVSFGQAAIAGVAAALAVTAVEFLLKRTPLNAGASAEEPPTETLANEISKTIAGDELHGFENQAAGLAIHCATGAALGVAYAQLRHRSTLGTQAAGAIFGLGVWAGLEEAGLSAVGLKPAPWRAKLSEHARGAALHLIFGLALANLYEHESRKRLGSLQNPAAPWGD